jgi:hypothetical protein
VSGDGEAFGLTNFVAVEVVVSELEWLYLAHAGHRRALYTYQDGRLAQQTWLAP